MSPENSLARAKENYLGGARIKTSVHRGLWGPLPENSLPAIKAAAAWDIVEIDLRLDADGTPYLMHDRTFDRMCGQDVSSNGVPIDAIAAAKLKAGAGGAEEAFTEETVPTLQAAFAALEGSGAIFDLDVKRAEDVQQVAKSVSQMGQQHLGTLKVDVASKPDVDALLALENQFEIMVMAKFNLRTKDDLPLIAEMAASGVAAIEIWFDNLDLLAEATRIAGDKIRIGTYTLDPVHCCGLSDAKALNDPASVWGKLIDAGIGLIMTDQPQALEDYLRSR